MDACAANVMTTGSIPSMHDRLLYRLIYLNPTSLLKPLLLSLNIATTNSTMGKDEFVFVEKDEKTQDEGNKMLIKDKENDSLGLIKTNNAGETPPIPPIPPSQAPPSAPPAPGLCAPTVRAGRLASCSSASIPILSPPPPPPRLLPIVRRYNDLSSLNSGDTFMIPAECSSVPMLGCFTTSRHSRPSLNGYAEIIAAKHYQWVSFDGTPVANGKPGKTAIVTINFGRAMSGELDILQKLKACYCIIVRTEIEDTRSPSNKCAGAGVIPGSKVFEVRALLSGEQARMETFRAALGGESTVFSYAMVPDATKETVMAYAPKGSDWQIEERLHYTCVY